MQNDRPERVEVTQADRDAAVDLAHALTISCEDFTSGAADILVQAFARHRIAALRPAERLSEAVNNAAKAEREAILVERDAEIERLRFELEWAANQLDPLPDDD